MKTNAKQTLKCCDDGTRYVRLSYPSTLFYDERFETPETFEQFVHDVPPDWALVVHADRDPDATPPAYGCTERVALHERCPFCSADLPELRLKARPPKRITTVIDGGYYCATCAERLNCCECAPPDRLWEVVRS